MDYINVCMTKKIFVGLFGGATKNSTVQVYDIKKTLKRISIEIAPQTNGVDNDEDGDLSVLVGVLFPALSTYAADFGQLPEQLQDQLRDQLRDSLLFPP